MSSRHSLDFELTSECTFSFRRTSLQIDCHQPVLHKSFKGKVTLSHSHCFELTHRWVVSQHLARLLMTASRSITSKYSSPSIIACCKCISILPRSQLRVHLSVCSITASKCISKLTRSRPRSSFPYSLSHGLQVHLWVHSISASKCISQLARSRPPSTLLLNNGGCTEKQG